MGVLMPQATAKNRCKAAKAANTGDWGAAETSIYCCQDLIRFIDLANDRFGHWIIGRVGVKPKDICREYA